MGTTENQTKTDGRQGKKKQLSFKILLITLDKTSNEN